MMEQQDHAQYHDATALPIRTRQRYFESCLDFGAQCYPAQPDPSAILEQVLGHSKCRSELSGSADEYVDPGTRADPSMKELFNSAMSVIHLTRHIGTELVGIQLSNLTSKQLDQLARLIAERPVVFLRDQKLSPQEQRKIGEYFGNVEIHPSAPHVPGLPGVQVIWTRSEAENIYNRRPGGTGFWHADISAYNPPGITHLHMDHVPDVGGDTLWASGYAAYEKLSPGFAQFVDGLWAFNECITVKNLDTIDKTAQFSRGVRRAPIVRVHPVTGWKSLFVNRAYTRYIEGLEPSESESILNFLFDLYERNPDIQVRFRWTGGTSALWDERISIHCVSWDWLGCEDRHGTRVASEAEIPIHDPMAFSRKEALRK